MSNVLHQCPADFKKTPGTLTITRTDVAWVPATKGAMDRQNQALSRITNMLASKAGAAKVSLKLVFQDDIPQGGLLFVFTNPDMSTRENDRKVVQDIVIPFVSSNRASGGAAPAAPLAAPISAPGTPSALLGKRKADADGESVSADSPAPSGSGGIRKKKAPDPLARERNKLRTRVLKKNPTLALLHKELVLNNQITEEEFWDGREGLVNAERIAQAQKPGRQSRLLDDRFDLNNAKKAKAGAGGTGVGIKSKDKEGPQTIEISREVIAEIFEEFPVVQDAYARHVPGISEAEFWKRYFESQLWERHRASVRQSAADEHSMKKDDIFDQYLEDPDWNIEPKKASSGKVVSFLDLSATEEDHGETTTQRDVTMQAGRQRTALPLIRRFNEHSNHLLHHNRTPATATIDPEGGLEDLRDDVDIYDEIELEDLRVPAAPATIHLAVQEADDEDAAQRTTRRGIMPEKSDEDLLELAQEQAGAVHAFSQSLESVCIPTPPGGWAKNKEDTGASEVHMQLYNRNLTQKSSADVAVMAVRDMLLASNAEHAIAEPFPAPLLDQIRSCHNAATEFLRQYWTAILPLAPGALGGPSATPSARSEKADRMIEYLKGTGAKVEAVIRTAQLMQGVDPLRVKAVLSPTVGAVEVALRRDAKRARILPSDSARSGKKANGRVAA